MTAEDFNLVAIGFLLGVLLCRAIVWVVDKVQANANLKATNEMLRLQLDGLNWQIAAVRAANPGERKPGESESQAFERIRSELEAADAIDKP